jgi:hypothetical protein
LKAVQAEAAAENAAAEARRAAAAKAEAAYYASATTPVANPGRKGKGMFSNIPGSGFGVPNPPPVVTAVGEGKEARDWIRAAGEKKVQKARELLARLKSGESYAALVAERDGAAQQRQEAAEVQEDRTSEAYLKRVAEVQEEQRLIKAAWKWYRSPGRPEEIRTKTSLYASHDSAEHEKWILPMYKQALAEDAAGRGSSE